MTSLGTSSGACGDAQVSSFGEADCQPAPWPRVSANRVHLMWLFVIAIAALALGNLLRRLGIEAARANAYRSTASLAGQRMSGIGNWIYIAGAFCLLVAALRPWL